ncbi:aldose epimerase family protein [Herbidospora sp. NBRC 101105]|uniref:aldose epimerase family protein n=1 Tax=Herbidospora sp. NBRC 101105 TaxID=3032195 RepID=UPI0024A12DA1|nr:aldose epimerase family protein [Herbidospora sp. NBRC 101105]GLX92194.1 aldose 1-epimerase [Herbidospora sp. NBRC 101105]
MNFGQTPEGEKVERHVLTGGGLTAAVLTYGCVIQSLEVDGVDVVLGCDTLGDYLTRSRYFGAVVGRYGNRIAGGRFDLDGTTYRLARNNGTAALHGGVRGFDKRVWSASAAADTIVLRHMSPDGEEGYPGTLSVQVTYTLADRALRIDYAAVTDAPTVLNLTNHSYFNLAGGGDVLGHVVTIDADAYTPVDEHKIPTGELAPVEGTPFDFRSPAAVGARMGGVYDHNYVLNLGGLIRVECGDRVMEVATDQPGVQFYAGGMLSPELTPYGPHAGLCLETQHFPDSPNQPGFPSVVLRPGEEFRSWTEYRFPMR